MRTNTFLIGGVATLMLAATLTACGSDDDPGTGDNGEPADTGGTDPDPTEEPDATEEPEPSEEPEAGSLVVYSARGEDQVADLVDRFTTETGIEVEVYYGNDFGTGQVLLEHEAGATVADVFWSQDAGSLAVLSDAGVTLALPDSITSQVDPAFTADNGEWVGLTGRIRVFAYNSELIDEADVPDQVADFADPEWAGRVEVPPTNATFQAFVTALREVEGEDGARAWLEGLEANLPDGARPGNNRDTLQLVEDGEVEVGLINHYYLYQRAAETDGGLDALKTRNKIAAPGDLGSMVNVTGVAALSDNPDALVFIEYLLSQESQAWFAEVSYEYPLVPGAPAPEGLPPLEDFVEVNERFSLNNLSDLEDTQDLLVSVGLL